MLRSHENGVSLVEADVGIISALLDLAEDEFLFGTSHGASHALQIAEDAYGDGQSRLPALRDRDFQRLNPRLIQLRHAIDSMKRRLPA